MKDYSVQLMKVLAFNIRIDTASDPKSPVITGFSEAVSKLNSMIQQEVSGLEMEIVNLTEQLIEDDSLLTNVRRKRSREYSY